MKKSRTVKSSGSFDDVAIRHDGVAIDRDPVIPCPNLGSLHRTYDVLAGPGPVG
jgi:hypothetical protein